MQLLSEYLLKTRIKPGVHFEDDILICGIFNRT